MGLREQAVARVISSCANPGQSVQLAANQSFIVATGMQTPARGRLPQPPHAVSAPENGLANAFNTLHLVFDPDAPPALVRAMADSIAPACADCDLAPETLGISIDIKPGSANNCINPGSSGVIPVTLLGSADFTVADVRLDDSLRLGSLGLRVRGKGPSCPVTAVNFGKAQQWGPAGRQRRCLPGALTNRTRPGRRLPGLSRS